ncbi:MAG: endonuclease [Dehalococcoidia bacterium]|nr:endonuclease [Dehalococcoidia bacterium]MQG16597.1 endonuclease [SAR202 cluster bacterium]|tara:strand:- start:104130 stop:104495 length:366 start_codon:yes stop_codon:yes gene_type:complete
MDQVSISLFIIVLLLALLFLLAIRQIFGLRGDIANLKSKRQSQSTKYGQITEQFMPWSLNYPYDPAKFRFIGSPIDGIQFEEDKVILMEFKVSTSQMTSVQRRVKRLVDEGKVAFEEIRLL